MDPRTHLLPRTRSILQATLLALLVAASAYIATPASGPPAVQGPYDFLDGSEGLGGPVVLEAMSGDRQRDVAANDRSRPGQILGCTVQSETSVAAFGRNVYVGYNDTSQCVDPFIPQSGASFFGFARSTDGGKTFTDLGPLEPNGGVASLFGDPVVIVDTTGRGSGTVYLSSLATDLDGHWILAVGRSTDQGHTFRWRPVPAGATPDKEWLAIDNSGGPRDGTLYLVALDFGGSSGIGFQSSRDGGATWSGFRHLETGSVQGARLAVGPDGDVHAAWERTGGEMAEIRWSRSLDGGRSWSRPLTVGRVGFTDEGCGVTAVRELRRNEFPSLAVDVFGSSARSSPDYNPMRGSVYIVHGGAGRGGDPSDVFLSRLPRGARKWSASRRVNDDRTPNAQFFPEVVATGPGSIAISWTDRREDPAITPGGTTGDSLMRQWLATSVDGGRTIARNVPFSDVLFPPPFTNPSLNLGLAPCYAGDYNGLYADRQGHVVAAWSDNRDSVRVAGDAETIVVPDQNVYVRGQSVPTGAR